MRGPSLKDLSRGNCHSSVFRYASLSWVVGPEVKTFSVELVGAGFGFGETKRPTCKVSGLDRHQPLGAVGHLAKLKFYLRIWFATAKGSTSVAHPMCCAELTLFSFGWVYARVA